MTIPAKVPGKLDPGRLAIQVALYVLLVWFLRVVVVTLLVWLGGLAFGAMLGILATAALANLLVLRFFTDLRLVDLGLWWNRASWDNLAFGLIGGVGSAVLVLAPPLLTGAARIAATPAEQPSVGAFFLIAVLFATGAMGEELMMRGYGFQVLLATCGEWAVILPVGIVFAWLHSGNPNATWLGLANTAGFGILFGYAFVRSRDLWLPAGLHFGWNVTLPLFGVNVSGLKMKMTGHGMVWSAGSLWSGGDYGPEASVLTSAIMVVLAVYLWKAPIRTQTPAPAANPGGEIIGRCGEGT